MQHFSYLGCPLTPIWMSHWRCRATEGAEFWISCKRPAFLSNFSALQLIQNSAPFVARQRQRDILINSLNGEAEILNLQCFFNLHSHVWAVSCENRHFPSAELKPEFCGLFHIPLCWNWGLAGQIAKFQNPPHRFFHLWQFDHLDFK